jgi:hypothetical protein
MADLETSLGKNQGLVLPKESDFKPSEIIEPPPLVPVTKKRLKNEIKEETSALERVVRLIGEEMINGLYSTFFAKVLFTHRYT